MESAQVEQARSVIRCPHCTLNQFLPSHQKCRRCGVSLCPPKPTPSAPMPWGKLLLSVRHERGISQLRVAMRMDVPRTFISRLEYRTEPPRVTTVIRLADALHVEPKALLPNVDEHVAYASHVLLEDPFLRSLADYTHDLTSDQQHVIVHMARSLASGQMMFREWVTVQ